MPKRSQPASPRILKRRALGLLVNHNYAMKATETWTLLGLCALTMGIHHLALKAFEAALAHSPNSLPTLLGWSHLLRMNDVSVNETVGCQAALQRLTKAVEQFPELAKLADFFKELTECYLLVNLNDPAQQAVQQAIQLTPQDALLFLLLAQSLIRMGIRTQAAQLLTHCLKLLPKLLSLFTATDIETARTAHAELAAIAAAEGNIEMLIHELTATLMLPPPSLSRINEHIALWCALATALERAGKIPEALDACERAELAVGPSPRILITHAYLLLLDELKPKAERAVSLLTRVVEAEPRLRKDEGDAEDTLGDFLPWCLLGKAYKLLDQPRAAYDSYQIALRRADGLPITWLAVGKLYLELKQLPDALAAYSQALRLQLNENSPGTAAAWDGLSCVYERCDDQLGDAADACLRAALCFQAYGDQKSADFYENRAKNLRLAALGKLPVPEWSEPVGVPNYFLRDLVNLLPNERIAFVKSINKLDATEPLSQTANMNQVPQAAAHPSQPPAPERKDQLARFELPVYHDPAYHARAAAGAPYRQGYPYETVTRGTSVASTPPPSQPQYVHGTPLAHAQMDRSTSQSQQPYTLAPPYKPELKLPAAAQLQPQHPGRHYWPQPHEHAASPVHGLVRGPPPVLAQYPPPAGVMSPPTAALGPGPQHRSPAPHPAEGYAIAMPPGYAYGQYMPIHGGMVAQVQPYGAAHWRR
ncbi:hypothetical protein HF325_002858 [Metschnikowia pulcherrima]|uniref:Uncharacterized protein n=1 Tax=Metschnikowia pulcherrima TaxID=27326 RepID=A0A8H7GR98_9ASCO|nr:hypothetical protein HF325_002858 [Metschnikowia pulcherrima]